MCIQKITKRRTQFGAERKIPSRKTTIHVTTRPCYTPRSRAQTTRKHSDEIDGVRCLCARISRIIGATADNVGRPGSVGWPSFGLPVGARVNGPSGSTQSAPRLEISCLPNGLLSSSWWSNRPSLSSLPGRTSPRMREILFACCNDE